MAGPPPTGLVGIAILTDANPNWRPGDYRWGCETSGIAYRYRALKLADRRDEADLLASDNRPFAWAIRAWLAAQEAGQEAEAQADARRASGRQLLQARRQGRLDAAQVLAILSFLGAIDRELGLTGEATMPEVLSYFERRALVQGRVEMILLQLAERCGPLDESLREQVAALDGDALLALGKALLDFTRPDDLRRWLAPQSSQR